MLELLDPLGAGGTAGSVTAAVGTAGGTAGSGSVGSGTVQAHFLSLFSLAFSSYSAEARLPIPGAPQDCSFSPTACVGWPKYPRTQAGWRQIPCLGWYLFVLLGSP